MSGKSYVVGGKSIWKSPNKKWSIEVPENGSRFFTGYRLGERILEVAISDGWIVYYAEMYKNGRYSVDEMLEYRVPKYVREKAFAILWKAYQNSKNGKKL